jgi:hypothetical protein
MFDAKNAWCENEAREDVAKGKQATSFGHCGGKKKIHTFYSSFRRLAARRCESTNAGQLDSCNLNRQFIQKVEKLYQNSDDETE